MKTPFPECGEKGRGAPFQIHEALPPPYPEPLNRAHGRDVGADGIAFLF